MFPANVFEDVMTDQVRSQRGQRERPANPVPSAGVLGISFAGDAWLIRGQNRGWRWDRKRRPRYSARRSAWAGKRGSVILGRNSSFHCGGVSSSIRLAGCVLIRSKTSRKYRKGSIPQSLQLAIRL